MMARVICFALLVGFSLGLPLPQELTLEDFAAADIRPNGARSLGQENFQGVLISAPYRQVRRQGRKGETNKIKFPTLTVQNPNTLAFGNPIQKVENENGPVFNNLLSTKDIETKIQEINEKEVEKSFSQNEPVNRKEQIIKDIELLEEVSREEQIVKDIELFEEVSREEQIIKDIELFEEVSLLEQIVELDQAVNEELDQAVNEELIEIGPIDLTPELAQSDVLYSDTEISDVLYSDEGDEELNIPVIVEEEKIDNIDNLEVSFIEDQPLIDMIDIKIPAFVGIEEEDLLPGILPEGFIYVQDIEEATLPSIVTLNIDTDSSVPERDFGLIQEV